MDQRQLLTHSLLPAYRLAEVLINYQITVIREMKIDGTVSISEENQLLLALIYSMHNMSPEREERFNDLVSHAADRCGEDQPVSEELFQSLEYFYLLRAKASVVLLEKFPDEDIICLAGRCNNAEGTFSMQEKLTATIQALEDGSWSGEYAEDEEEEKASNLLNKLASLQEFERYVLCDMLLLLQADEGLEVSELRSRLTARAKWLAGKYSRVQ